MLWAGGIHKLKNALKPFHYQLMHIMLKNTELLKHSKITLQHVSVYAETIFRELQSVRFSVLVFCVMNLVSQGQTAFEMVSDLVIFLSVTELECWQFNVTSNRAVAINVIFFISQTVAICPTTFSNSIDR